MLEKYMEFANNHCMYIPCGHFWTVIIPTLICSVIAGIIATILYEIKERRKIKNG